MPTATSIIVFDSTIIIGFLHNDQRAVDIFKKMRSRSIRPHISVMTKIELEIGTVTSKHKEHLNQLMPNFQCQPLIPEMVGNVVDLLRLFGNDRQQKAFMLPDIIIAATAKYINADIYTANLRHFKSLDLKTIQVHGYDDKP